MPEPTPVLTGSSARIFRAVAVTVVPAARRLEPEQWERALATVESALADRPPALRRQLRLFLRLLQWLPLARWLRPFTALPPARRARWLGVLQDFPVLRVRQGFWGLRTLCYMGYYGLPEVRREIGYRAHPRGWKAERVRRGEEDGADLEPGPEVQL